MANFRHDGSRQVCLQNAQKNLFQNERNSFAYLLNVSKFALKYLKKSSAYLIDIYVFFDQVRDAEFKNEVKTGSSFPRHFGEKLHFRVF